MIKMFLSLERKAFSRSASFKLNLAFKIIFGLIGAFYLVMVLALGVSVFYVLKEKNVEPLATINKYLVYWWVMDLISRYFLQKSPIMYVKPFLTMPIKKGKIVSFFLGKSALSFFNIYPAFFFLPFSIVMIVNGYPVMQVLSWHIAIMALVFADNYLNLLMDNMDRVFVAVLVILLSFAAMQYYGLLDITVYSTPVFQAFYNYPLPGFGMLAIPVFLYWYCFTYFKNNLRTDEAVQPKVKEAQTENFTWLEKFGTVGTFLKNDLKLILRNKRSKTTVLISFFFLFYGLLILTNKTYHNETWKLFAGLFISGGFLFTFGGFVPSWDSSYYPLMMSQNIRYKDYLTSKWWLIVIATLISMILASFYLFMGLHVYLAIIAAGIYNIGVNAHLVLLGGAFVKTPIDLTQGRKVLGDKKAFNIQTLVIALPKLVLPLVIFYIVYKYWNITAAYLSVALLGVLGLAFRNKMFRIIENIYKKEKYSTLAAYKQKN